MTTPEAIVAGKVQAVYGDFKDEDFQLVEFQPAYTGNRQLVGAATKINYGYSRRPGDKFLVHKADAAAQPHLFKPVQMQPAAPKVETKPLPEPEPIAALEPVAEKKVTAPPAKLPKGVKRKRSTLA